MKNMKFKVLNEQHSKEIQECLFELGFIWISCGVQALINKDKKFLFTDIKDMSITYNNNDIYFNNDYRKETTLEELKQMLKQTKKQPHVHADLIKAWADGAEIQFKREDGIWFDCHNNKPDWDHRIEYRIKPELTDIQKYDIEVGDIWTDETSSVVIKEIFSKENFTILSITGSLCQLEDKDELIFRRGVIDRLNEL